MDINYELYKVFYHVAKTLSFSEASNHLYISQSAVSQAIRTLENKLGCKLFFRSTKRVSLTSEGEILFRHIEQAFNLIYSGERILKDMQSLKYGEIRIGASDTICKHYLLPYLKNFNELYPQIKIHITNRPSPTCVELLKNGSVDIVVANLPQNHTYKNMRIDTVRTFQDVFVAGKSFEYLKNRDVILKDLENYPVLMLEKNSATREFFDTFLKENDVNIIPEIEVESIDLLVELAKIGLGIGFVAKDFITKELANNEIFILNLREKSPKRNIGIITLSNQPLPKAVEKFYTFLKSK